ncbi:hypothetical protein FPV67DRAFT_1448721 [Lyophyllum atratum]|nr:hypothetical protein FPV67DRAFT_1448721 [Lyophyllum atratum]
MPDTRLQSDAAQLVGVFVECIFYGIYLITFISSLKCILWSGPQRTWASRLTGNWLMSTVVLLMFIFSTLNLALGLVRLLQGLVYHTHPGGGAIKELGQDWINIIKPLCVHLQTITVDVVLIYRCWVMYDKSYRVVVFPTFLWLGGVAGTAVSMYMQGILTSGSRVAGGKISLVYIGFWSGTIAINIYATTLIVLQIWRAVNETARAHRFTPFFSMQPRGRLHTVMRIIVESGLIYTVMTVIIFITQITGSDSVYITTAAGIQITGITFNLILIRAKRASDHATIGAGNVSEHISFTARPTRTSAYGNRKYECSTHGDVEEELTTNDIGLDREVGFDDKTRDIRTRHSSSF